MSNDDDYMAFLNKANEDPSKGYEKSATTQSSSKAEFKTTDSGAKVPAVLSEATQDAFYISDADEPFVPVYLTWNETGKGLPDEGQYPCCVFPLDQRTSDVVF